MVGERARALDLTGKTNSFLVSFPLLTLPTQSKAFLEGLNGGGGGGGPHVGCRLKFHFFVGCRLKFSTFVGCR